MFNYIFQKIDLLFSLDCYSSTLYERDGICASAGGPSRFPAAARIDVVSKLCARFRSPAQDQHGWPAGAVNEASDPVWAASSTHPVFPVRAQAPLCAAAEDCAEEEDESGSESSESSESENESESESD